MFGYGRGGRPLWSVRDRDAEWIRKTLRGAGLREFSERHDGSAVEGDGTPSYVGCADEETAERDLKAAAGARGLSNNGTASGDSGLKAAWLGLVGLSPK